MALWGYIIYPKGLLMFSNHYFSSFSVSLQDNQVVILAEHQRDPPQYLDLRSSVHLGQSDYLKYSSECVISSSRALRNSSVPLLME